MHDYGKLKSLAKSDTSVILTFEHGVITVRVERTYDDSWLIVEELTNLQVT